LALPTLRLLLGGGFTSLSLLVAMHFFVESNFSGNGLLIVGLGGLVACKLSITISNL